LDGPNAIRPDTPAVPRFVLDAVFDPTLWGGFTGGPLDISDSYQGASMIPCEYHARVRLQFPGGNTIVEADNQGCELCYAQAQFFQRLNRQGAHPFNRAILAFIAELPPDTPIVLFWS
jgi:hypothetical protein